MEPMELDKNLSYQKARRIRGAGLSTIFADQMMYEPSIMKAAQRTLSLKVQSKAKGLMEKFDPLNIAKTMTFGSNWAPALLGKITGRSKKDIQYFTGRSGARFSSVTSTPKEGEELIEGKNIRISGSKGMNEQFLKMYKLLKKSQDFDKRRRELDRNFDEEKSSEAERRHKELLKALNKLTGKSNKTEGGPPSIDDNTTPSLFDSTLEWIQDYMKKKAEEKLAKEAAAKAAEKAAAEAAAKTAAGAAGKEAAKEVVEVASKEAVKEVVEKTVVKKGLKGVLSKIPIVGVGIGAAFGLQRAIAGDYKGAALEVASGAASAFPGPGTAASIGFDVVNMGRDVYQEIYGKFPEDDDPKLVKKRMADIYGILQSYMGKESATEDNKNNTSQKISSGVSTEQANQSRRSFAQSDPRRIDTGSTTEPVTSGGNTQRLNTAMVENADSLFGNKKLTRKAKETASKISSMSETEQKGLNGTLLKIYQVQNLILK